MFLFVLDVYNCLIGYIGVFWGFSSIVVFDCFEYYCCCGFVCAFMYSFGLVKLFKGGGLCLM